MEGISGWIWFSILVVAVIIALLCYALAEKKGYENASIYAIVGFFFGAQVLVYVAGLPDKRSRKTLEEINKKLETFKDQMRKKIFLPTH